MLGVGIKEVAVWNVGSWDVEMGMMVKCFGPHCESGYSQSTWLRQRSEGAMQATYRRAMRAPTGQRMMALPVGMRHEAAGRLPHRCQDLGLWFKASNGESGVKNLGQLGFGS